MRYFALTIVCLLCAATTLISEEALDNREDLNNVLEKSESNRSELEQLLRYYSQAGDSLKQIAAEYLIANMDGHCYVVYELQDSTGRSIPFNILDYPDLDSLESAFRDMERKHGVLDFKEKERIEDLTSIKADYIIEQIDWAFKARQERPWAAMLSFVQFCDYVLPYRGSNEPLELWREYFWNRYNHIPTQMKNLRDPIEAAALINNDIKSWFTFDSRYYYHPTDQGLSEMLDHRMGRCEDMTNLTIYAMRANGLAVTSDFTPFWANSGNNHAWNAVVIGDTVIPFMGAESNPGEYGLSNKVAKVYRKMYGVQKQALAFQDNRQKTLPRYLSGKSYKDVTSAYTAVANAEREISVPIPDSVNIAYICVFNSGVWQPIHWSAIDSGHVRFSDMGTGIAYLVGFYMDHEVVPAADAFILQTDGTITELMPSDQEMLVVDLVSTTSRKQETSTDGITGSRFKSGMEYTLFYWYYGWREVSKTVAETDSLEFSGVPRGALYWLTAKESDKEERIFTLSNGQQVWW